MKENRHKDDILHDNIYIVQERVNLINGDRTQRGGYSSCNTDWEEHLRGAKNVLSLNIHAYIKVDQAVLLRLSHQMCVTPKKKSLNVPVGH